MQNMVESHEQELQKQGISRKEKWLVNLQNTPSWIGATQNVPALLRNTRLWSCFHGRLALQNELLEVMGYNIYDDDEYKCEFVEFLNSIGEQHLRAMTGNGMHLRAVGSIVMFVAACTAPA